MKEHFDPTSNRFKDQLAPGASRLPGEDAADTSTAAFVMACEASGLAELIQKSSWVTIFAPVDSAFRRVSDRQRSHWTRSAGRPALARLVATHIVPGHFEMGPFAVGRVTTLSGKQLAFLRTNDELWLGAAHVVEGPYRAGDCLLYLVDELAVPPESLT